VDSQLSRLERLLAAEPDNENLRAAIGRLKSKGTLKMREVRDAHNYISIDKVWYLLYRGFSVKRVAEILVCSKSSIYRYRAEVLNRKPRMIPDGIDTMALAEERLERHRTWHRETLLSNKENQEWFERMGLENG